MAEKTNKRKVVKAATAVGMAAVLLMGGTFAWQSISQEATNIVTAAVNPGGRLHDDFDGSNDKNIYVENFGTQNIYARIKLSEYLEIGQDAGNFAEGSNRETNLANGDIEVLLGEEIDTKATYTTYKYGETNTSDEYWTKDWDGSTKYIPTFNKDQDSLEADLNGTYEYVNDAGENVPYGDFVDYNTAAADYSETDIEWYDADTNDSAEAHVNPDSVTEGSHEIKEDQTHALADSIDGTVISMAEWDGTAGAYWVYDSDGWAYWAQAIEPGTATGLLLDSITDLGLIDEDYYYAIHVTGQFITAGDLGDTDNTGFYQNAGEEPTDAALDLLNAIGVKVGGSDEDPGTGDEPVAPTMDDLILVDDAADADKEIVLLEGNSVTLSIVETLNGSAVTEGSIGAQQEYTGVTLTDNSDGTYTLAADSTVTDGTVVELAASAMADGAAVMDQLSVKVYTIDEPVTVLDSNNNKLEVKPGERYLVNAIESAGDYLTFYTSEAVDYTSSSEAAAFDTANGTSSVLTFSDDADFRTGTLELDTGAQVTSKCAIVKVGSANIVIYYEKIESVVFTVTNNNTAVEPTDGVYNVTGDTVIITNDAGCSMTLIPSDENVTCQNYSDEAHMDVSALAEGTEWTVDVTIQAVGVEGGTLNFKKVAAE